VVASGWDLVTQGSIWHSQSAAWRVAANARAVFSKALSFDAPNRRMTAAIYYNRSACQRQLGQLSLALRDAQLVRTYPSLAMCTACVILPLRATLPATTP
jgi:hypothetical protein